MTDAFHWGTDVPVSMPQPLDDLNPALVDMDGFCFTATGIAHNLSQADWERYTRPTFAPVGPTDNTVRYDASLDGPKGAG